MTKAVNNLHCEPLAVRSPQAALLLGVSEKTLIEWNKSDNPPPHIRRGGCVLYPVAELRQWLASQIVSDPNEQTTPNPELLHDQN
jgi:predicted DNA-binding transcriptional regulator AlpA